MKLLLILKKSAYTKFLLIIPVVLIAIVVLVSFTRKDKKDNSEKVQKGIAYLEALEAKDPKDMLDELREKNREKQAAKVDEILAKIDSGEISIWSQFKDAAILGDSRAEDFVADGFLTATNVYAEKGTMCTDAMEYMEAVAASNPSRVFFTYGMNDVDGYWNTVQDFIEGYTKVIKAYRERMPNAVIFVNSIIPVNDHAIANDANYKAIPEYNEAMKKMADELGVCWIDCDSYLTDYPELYDTDGQHFFPEMYPIWAKTMLKAAFDYEFAHNGEAAVSYEAESTNTGTGANGTGTSDTNADATADGMNSSDTSTDTGDDETNTSDTSTDAGEDSVSTSDAAADADTDTDNQSTDVDG